MKRALIQGNSCADVRALPKPDRRHDRRDPGWRDREWALIQAGRRPRTRTACTNTRTSKAMPIA
ncbi:MAG: hypothetical protein WAR01_13515, partial [Dokdonella sp.]|uniref:hypothetical protein n=1 Tax=Dokdonella sp. TaxID=2291710 RepID=UPI002CB9FA01|nr:hypothetical protein [Dokdonella sp.]HQX66069.1 hypothetical protein [Dokdonella sp.]HQY55553.1 hypothetical protein [Dokdonella sp.]HQZ61731.1 hypothetical protein [Dokdonella sp.]